MDDSIEKNEECLIRSTNVSKTKNVSEDYDKTQKMDDKEWVKRIRDHPPNVWNFNSFTGLDWDNE
jgi:hypothetical protein